jgi:hypothetical protein
MRLRLNAYTTPAALPAWLAALAILSSRIQCNGHAFVHTHVAKHNIPLLLACVHACTAAPPPLLRETEQYVFEPLTAGTLETMHLGVETSYKTVMGIKVRRMHR